MLFLLHGIGSASRGWLHQFPAFAGRYRIIAWGAPGYGQSTDVDSETPMPRDYALILRDLFDALEIGRAILCGNSLGALFSASLRQHRAGAGRRPVPVRRRPGPRPAVRSGAGGETARAAGAAGTSWASRAWRRTRAGNLLAPDVPEELRDTDRRHHRGDPAGRLPARRLGALDGRPDGRDCGL